MPVIRGDRIGESERLTARTPEAQDFYAHLIAAVPDDFGRFRLSTPHVTLRMYPRREPTPALLRRVGRLLHQLGAGERPLWSTWEVDGVRFAALHNWTPTGNRYHRTPEPPGSPHVHQGACLSTAIHRAREWGQLDVASALSRQLSNLRDRRRTEPIPEPHRKGTPPSPPSPPSQRNTPQTPLEEGGSVCTSRRFERRRQIRDDADAVERYWIELGGHPSADERKRIRDSLREGRTREDLMRAVDDIVGER